MDDEEFHTRVGEAIWMEERFFAMLKVAVNRGFVGEE